MQSIKSDLLTETSGLIVHGVNCQGVMGKGIALSIRTKYPQVYSDYKSYCANNTNLLGQVIYTKITEDLIVASAFTQQYYGNKPEVYVSYDAIAQAFHTIQEDLIYSDRTDLVIKIPKIGTGLANGDWDIIKQIIESTITTNHLMLFFK
jgi:O-acetyl-ADP-ribose deacetylase (regulator of RNase III)